MGERSSEDMQPVLEALQRWAGGHPRSEQPFMVIRGRTFTPRTFYMAVREGSEYAEPFLDYIFHQARQEGIAPRVLIDREIRKQR
jgi:hypothetical protein